MKRDAKKDLIRWAGQSSFKPLIIRGARQVGKSYLVRELGKTHFEKFVELNFERNPEFIKLFESSDPVRIIRLIESLSV